MNHRSRIPETRASPPPEARGVSDEWLEEQQGFLSWAMLQGIPAASRRDVGISYVPLPVKTHPTNLLLAGWREAAFGDGRYHGVIKVIQGMVPLQNEEETNTGGGMV